MLRLTNGLRRLASPRQQLPTEAQAVQIHRVNHLDLSCQHQDGMRASSAEARDVMLGSIC